MVEGWIDEVRDGRVCGRCMVADDEVGFFIPLLSVLECQRGYIEPGAYVTFPNGYLLVHKSIWTTHDMEQADIEAGKWAEHFAQVR